MGFAQLVSDALSIFTISLCLFAKVPQIKSIYSVKNVRGINIYGLLMELSSYTTSALYNFTNGYALLTYMEYPILMIQDYVLVYLVLFYQNSIGTKSIIVAVTYCGVIASFLFGIIDGRLITYVLPLCTPVSLSSKALQLWEILRSKNADSVSVTTWVISAVTNGSRIYTIFLDSADVLLLTNFILSTILSSSIALVAYILQNQKSKSE